MRAFLTLHDPARAAAYYDSGVWADDTFYSLLSEHAVQRPDAIAVRDRYRVVDWKTLKAWTDATAADLHAQGLVQGDRVCLWMSNRIEAVVAFLACSRQGYACNPSLHRTNTSGEVVSLLNRLEAAALVTEPGWGADGGATNTDALRAEVGSLRTVYTPQTFPQPGAQPTAPAVTNPDLVSYLAFTSGTTGNPKCVMHSCNTILANARDLVKDWQVGADARLLTLSPVSHHIAWVGASQWLLSGCAFVLGDPPEGQTQLDWIAETGATYVLGVPTHAMDVLAQCRDAGSDGIGKVQVFYMAGAAIPPSVAEAFVQLGITPQNVYGMTENSSHQYTHRDDAFDIVVGTTGRGGRAYEVRIFDAGNSNVEVEKGVVGQIGGRGGALMLGYYGNQEATAASFNDSGWFLSGDLGSVDAHGNLKIEGRLKDLIIRGGHNIYPAEIEALALRHDRVDKAAAFPVADERLGEKVCLAIIGSAEAEALLQHLAAEGLSKYDMPEYFLILKSFPLTASGKILKRELVTMAQRGDIEPVAIRFQAKRESA
ncbi:MAG TPA: class I adenylate-forming enzyme family protein [Burkholderiales bacterium]|nr:class I adenylate-forming enzyme family protein [Burkholderiales bacterium]